MKNVFIFWAVLLAVPAFCQPPDTMWTRVYGTTSDDAPTFVRPLSDGGYLIGGYTMNSNLACLMIRTDSSGNTLWQHSSVGMNRTWLMDGRELSDGNLIVVADTGSCSFQDCDSMAVIVTKLTQQGDTIWSRICAHGLGMTALRIAELENGNLVLGGYYRVESIGQYFSRGFIQAMTAEGDFLWSFLRGGGLHPSVSFTDVTCGPNTDVTFVGYEFYDYYGPPPRYEYHWIRQTLLYQISGNGDSTAISEWRPCYAYLIDAIQTGGYLVTGGLCETGQATFVQRLNSNNDVEWTHPVEGSIVDFETCRDNGYVIISTVPENGSDIFFRGFTNDGVQRWGVWYGGSGSENAVYVETGLDSSLIIAGTTTSWGAGGTDIYLIKTAPVTSLEIDRAFIPHPSSFTISSYPNPFNSSTTIEFSLSRRANVTIDVFDLQGRLVKAIVKKDYEPGVHRVPFDGSALPTGIYFARLTTPGYVGTEKLLLLR